MKKGFTLIELMVVIGIIGILAAILLRSVGGSTDSARAARCLANMHNLASACQSVGMSTGRYPLAGSVELGTISVNKSSSGTVREKAGWVSWASKGAYKNGPKAHRASSGWFISTYEKDQDTRLYALTNGSIWHAIGGDASSYRCPLHERFARKKKLMPAWSYVMNSYFLWDDTIGGKTLYADDRGHLIRDVKNLDRRLLFAELPFNAELNDDRTMNFHPTIDYSTASGVALDPTLQYSSPQQELIGFNHKSGKKWYAHICFADGHAEKLELPKNAGQSQIREITQWLCEGTAFGYNGSKYETLTK